jgi:hypothetical protein
MGGDFQERVQAIRDTLAAHTMAGRMSNGPAWRQGAKEMATFCSCGLVFYGRHRAEADNRWGVHHSDALGGTVTSLEIDPGDTDG